MRIVGVPVVDGDPIESGPKIGFHLPREVSREGSEIGHLRGVFGRDDEAEVVPVILRSIGKSSIVGTVALGVEHARLLAVARNALALQIGDMRRHRRRAESTALMARNSRLHHDAAGGREQSVAAEREPPAPESRVTKACRLAATRLRSGMARPLCGAQHLVDEALGSCPFVCCGCAPAGRGSPPRCRLIGVSQRGRESDSAESRVRIIECLPGSGTRPDRAARRKTSPDKGLDDDRRAAFI